MSLGKQFSGSGFFICMVRRMLTHEGFKVVVAAPATSNTWCQLLSWTLVRNAQATRVLSYVDIVAYEGMVERVPPPLSYAPRSQNDIDLLGSDSPMNVL